MKETKKCSISGIAFTLDADAYELLEGYLERLRNAYRETEGGREIVADIEARIAELILSEQENTLVVARPLIERIIARLGDAETLGEEEPAAERPERIPRRLYRDMENARLGGVCSGLGKYFHLEPVWLRIGIFVPLLLAFAGSCIPGLWWVDSAMMNLFGILLLCYLILWFAIPAARTPRQKLEQRGERVTVDSIRREAVEGDADQRAKPIVADLVYTLGRVMLIFFKIFAVLVLCGLVLLACALVIGLITLLVFEPDLNHSWNMMFHSVWIPALGILVMLVPALLLCYVIITLVAGRKPSKRVLLPSFLLIFVLFMTLAVSSIIAEVRGEQPFRVGNTSIQWKGNSSRGLPAPPMLRDSLGMPIDPVMDAERTIDGDSVLLQITTPEGDVQVIQQPRRVEIRVDEKEDDWDD